MPWTHITSPQVLNAFANRLARQAMFRGNQNELVQGIQVCGQQFDRLAAPGAYRHLVVIAEEAGFGNPRAALNALYAAELIDQSSGIGTFEFPAGVPGRQYILEQVADSVVPVSSSIQWEDNLGMAASVPTMLDPGFPDLLDLFIKRVMVCPGDYNRDGEVEFDDFAEFQDDLINEIPYADWNFDGDHDSDPDFLKFEAGYLHAGCGGP